MKDTEKIELTKLEQEIRQAMFEHFENKRKNYLTEMGLPESDYNLVFDNPLRIEDFTEEARVAAALCRTKIEQAFVAGRSKTSWEQFQKDNGF